jgi:hypothetical protein
MNAEVREPREMWRKFVRGDFDADEPPERIREWLEATDYEWRDGEWPPYIVWPRWDGTPSEFWQWVEEHAHDHGADSEDDR